MLSIQDHSFKDHSFNSISSKIIYSYKYYYWLKNLVLLLILLSILTICKVLMLYRNKLKDNYLQWEIFYQKLNSLKATNITLNMIPYVCKDTNHIFRFNINNEAASILFIMPYNHTVNNIQQLNNIIISLINKQDIKVNDSNFNIHDDKHVEELVGQVLYYIFLQYTNHDILKFFYGKNILSLIS